MGSALGAVLGVAPVAHVGSRPANGAPAPLHDPDQLRVLLGLAFTDEQLQAATAPLQPGLIVAGAGSGKTSVMAARVVWLVGTGQVESDRVLGLTFTNKAAAELAHRVSSALTKAGLTGGGSGADGVTSAESLGEPVVQTYHAFAGRLVSEHGLRLGIEPRSRLLADATRFQLAGRVLRRHPGPVVHLTRQLATLIGDLVSLESELSEHLVSPDELHAYDDTWIARLEPALAEAIGLKGGKGHSDLLTEMLLKARQRQELTVLVRAYRAAKADLDAVDFGDQVAFAARLAEGAPEVGAAERSRAEVVLLDEYQDTSVAQRRMLAGLFGSGHPVTAVGDPCQAIYGWRGASVANLDSFPEHFPCSDGTPALRHSLAVNQRSGGRLLELANRVADALLTRHRVSRLRPPAGKEQLGETVVALHVSWADEVQWVAQQIRARIEAGTPAGECAVLVRARSDFGDLRAALAAEGLPVEVVGLGGLLALPEVADVVATLEVIDDPTANAALLRLLTGPRWRLGARDLARLGRRASELLHAQDPRPVDGASTPGDGPSVTASPAGKDDAARVAADAAVAGRTDADDDATDTPGLAGLHEAVQGIDPCDVVALADALERPGHDGWSLEGLQRITALAAELRGLRRARDEPLLDLVHRIVRVTGLDVELGASPEAVDALRQDALAAFLDVVASFVDLDGDSNVTSFLAYLRAADDYDRGLDSVTPSGSDAVQLLTAHKAKGLEWDVVACPDLTKTVFPATTVRDQWHKSSWVLPAALRGDAADQPELGPLTKEGLEAFKRAAQEHLEREERRLGYVAFTRARHVLIGSAHWWGPTQTKLRGPSSFLDDLRQHTLDQPDGAVACWAEQPQEDRNPLLDHVAQLAWPAPYDLEPHGRRLAAAAAVRADLLALSAGDPLPEDDTGGLTARERQLLERLDRDGALLVQEERTSRRVGREVELPLSLSASQLLRLKDDPDGFARELARPLPRRPAPAASRGTRFHAWVETLFDQRALLDPDDLPGAEDDGRADDAQLAALQQAFLTSPWASRRPHAVEAPFALPLAGRLLRGRIDAVYDLGGGRWEVVDWKTGSETADPLQLAVYRLAWARLVDVSVEDVDATFLYVATGRAVSYDDLPDESALTRLLSNAPQTAEPLRLL